MFTQGRCHLPWALFWVNSCAFCNTSVWSGDKIFAEFSTNLFFDSSVTNSSVLINSTNLLSLDLHRTDDVRCFNKRSLIQRLCCRRAWKALATILYILQPNLKRKCTRSSNTLWWNTYWTLPEFTNLKSTEERCDEQCSYSSNSYPDLMIYDAVIKIHLTCQRHGAWSRKWILCKRV